MVIKRVFFWKISGTKRERERERERGRERERERSAFLYNSLLQNITYVSPNFFILMQSVFPQSYFSFNLDQFLQILLKNIPNWIKKFLRFAVFCIPNVIISSDIDISKPFASKTSLNFVQKNCTCLHSQNR